MSSKLGLLIGTLFVLAIIILPGAHQTKASGTITGNLKVDNQVGVTNAATKIVTYNVDTNTSITLSWSIDNPGQIKSCQALGNWNGSKSTSGTQTIGKLAKGTYNYSLNCTDNKGNTGGPAITVVVTDAGSSGGSTAPTTSPTVSGTVFVEPGDIPIIDSTITLTQGSTTDSTSPDQNGKYQLGTSVKFNTGQATIAFTPNLSTSKAINQQVSKISLSTGNNTKNFTTSVLVNDPNKITIKVVDSVGNILPVELKIIINHNGNNTYDHLYNGVSEWSLAHFGANTTEGFTPQETIGNYQVYGELLSDNIKGSATDTQSFTCTTTSGCKPTITLHLNDNWVEKSKQKINLRIILHNNITGPFNMSGLVSGVRVVLYDNNKKYVEDKDTDYTGIAVFNDLERGIYYIDVYPSLNYFKTIRYYQIDARGIENEIINKSYGLTNYITKMIELDPIYSSTNCINDDAFDNTQYWVCGDDAKKMDYKSIDKKIQTELSKLKSESHLSTTPQVVMIGSINEEQGYYNDQDAKNCSFPAVDKNDLLNSEFIFLSSEFINKNPTLINDVVVHEFGHAIDWHRGNCTKNWSDTDNNFSTTRNFGSSYSNNYWAPIEDSTYDGFGGHPEDNPTETFASTFHDIELYSSKFPDQSKTTSETIKNAVKPILLKTGQLVKQAAGIP